MTDSDFTRLLSQAVKAAQKHRGLMFRINKECIRRFGRPLGDLSLNETLELNHQVGSDLLTAKRVELLMQDSPSELH